MRLWVALTVVALLLAPATGLAAKKYSSLDKLLEAYSEEACATCHGEIYEQWKASMHSKSVVTSLKGMRNFFVIGVGKEWGRKLSRVEVLKCLDCHAPVMRYATEKLALKVADMIIEAKETKDEKKRERLKKELSRLNVGCLSCHNIKATTMSIGLLGEPEPGVVYGAHGKPSPAHETVEAPQLERSLFCMQCHGIFYAPDGEFIMCNTLSESFTTAYLARGGTKTCQDCHYEEKNRGHRFPGGHDLDIVDDGLDMNVEIRPYRHLPGKGETKWRPSAYVSAEILNKAGHRVPDG
jgi:nitrate/TMAO reductase-like tetraheme cytochrome c subunit